MYFKVRNALLVCLKEMSIVMNSMTYSRFKHGFDFYREKKSTCGSKLFSFNLKSQKKNQYYELFVNASIVSIMHFTMVSYRKSDENSFKKKKNVARKREKKKKGQEQLLHILSKYPSSPFLRRRQAINLPTDSLVLQRRM